MLNVYTFGDGQIIAAVFNGIVMLTKILPSLVEACLILGLLAAVAGPLMSFFDGGNPVPQVEGATPVLSIIRQSVLAVFALALFLGINPLDHTGQPGAIFTRTVYINDQVDPSQNQAVDNVPIAVAYVSSYTSEIGEKLGTVFETYLLPVDASYPALQFQHGGLAMGARYLNDLLDITPPSAPADYGGSGYTPIDAAVTNYFDICVFPNLAVIPGNGSDEARGLDQLTTETGFFTDSGSIFITSPLFADPNTYLQMNLESGNTTGNYSNWTSCAGAGNDIVNAWNPIIQPWVEDYTDKSLGIIPDQSGGNSGWTIANDVIERYFPGVDPSSAFVQIAVLNSIRSSLLGFDAQNGGGTALQNQLANKEVGAGWIQAARLFGQIAIEMRTVFEALIYGLTALLPVFFVLGGFKALVSYLKISLWLQLWIPFYVILNLIGDVLLSQMVQTIMNSTQTAGMALGISFRNLEGLRTHANIVLGLVGVLCWSVPAFAWGLVKGGEYALSQGIGAATTANQGVRTAQQVGSQVGGAGDATVGHLDFSSHSFMSGTGATSRAQLLDGTANAFKWDRLTQQFGGGGPATGGVGETSYKSQMKSVGGMSTYADGAQAADAGRKLESKVFGAMNAYNGAHQAYEAGLTGEQRFKADQATFRGIAAQAGMSVESFQAAVSTMSIGAKKQFLQEWAKAHGRTVQQAGESIARITGDQNWTNLDAWNQSTDATGGPGTRASLQAAQQESDLGKVAGFMGAINSYNVVHPDHPLSAVSFGFTQGKTQSALAMGALEEYRNGSLSLNDYMRMGRTGVLTESGLAKAREEVANTMYPGDPEGAEKVAEFTKSWEGMNEMAKFMQLGAIAKSEGIKGKFDAAMAHQGHGVNMALNQEQAEAAFGAGAQAGTYSVSRTNDGHMVYTMGRGGQDLQEQDINKNVRDHRNLDASGTQVTRGTDYQSGNDVIAAIETGNGQYLSGYSGYLRGQTPTRGGYALVKSMADQLGGFGKISQAVQDIASVSAGGGGGFDLSKSFLGEALGLSLHGGVDYKGERRGWENVDANAIRNAMDTRYREIMAQTKPPTVSQEKFMEWRQQQVAQMGNQIKQIMDYQAKASTTGQLWNGADNPAKGQFRTSEGKDVGANGKPVPPRPKTEEADDMTGGLPINP
jgi:TraG-like protein, N-terminal region